MGCAGPLSTIFISCLQGYLRIIIKRDNSNRKKHEKKMSAKIAILSAIPAPRVLFLYEPLSQNRTQGPCYLLPSWQGCPLSVENWTTSAALPLAQEPQATREQCKQPQERTPSGTFEQRKPKAAEKYKPKQIHLQLVQSQLVSGEGGPY